ncbi:Oxysterol-binding 1 [Elsinoe australis]|uniref:Oxysterol-binding 1 n=1 Tax=Elsinoe australis TaxID=40998 RepID=A0A2P7YIV8_9PEZI|nr:Oxysterol-binding 1 [Elsinoe australis]
MSNGHSTRFASQNVSAQESSHKEPSNDPRVSYEQPQPNDSPTTTGPARIRKKRSSANVQAGSQNRYSTTNSALDGVSKTSGSVNSTPGKTARKGSLRNVVRKIFGRKPKVEDEEVKTTPAKPPSRHGYTTSDPGVLRPIPEQAPAAPQTTTSALSSNPPQRAVPQRTLSAPLKLLDPPELRRARSPYAVEFPQSSRLKPLDLGNPFHKEQKEPKRRATLPSLIMDEKEAAVLAKAIQARSEDYNPDDYAGTRNPYDDAEIGLAVTTPTRKQNRRSRSADDLRRMAYSLQPVRKRTEEIKYWRQSTAGSVLRQPTLGHIDSDEIEAGLQRDVSPISEYHNDPFVVEEPTASADTAKVSPMRDSPLMSRPATAGAAPGTDLESRVTRLENGLATFQNALERLTAQSNRRTIIIDKTTSPRGSRQNTPSILVNSLLDADYNQREYSPVAENPYTDRRSREEATPRSCRQQEDFQPSPSRTYTALYSIINHERNARRTLENEVRALQQSLSDMQYQLSQPLIRRPTPSYSHRSLHQSQYGPQMTHFREASYATGNLDPNMPGQRLTSRFSLSDSLTDSEAARLRDTRDADDGDDTAKSFDLYQTPAEEQRQRSSQLVDGGMF